MSHVWRLAADGEINGDGKEINEVLTDLEEEVVPHN
jgi:hypothetical protein